MNAIQEWLLERTIESIALTLARAEELPTLTERAAIYESRLRKTRHAIEILQSSECIHCERKKARAEAAA